jgi:H/ACA ribonucleoprotein complex subunit 4
VNIESLINNSIVILDKPPGKSSHEITSWVKKIICAKRAGHAGTLDPAVSGVLPIALGRATKLLRYIVGKDKTYVGIIKFRNILSKDEIKNLFKKFTGEIIQTPPLMSAVRKVPRKRAVYTLELLEVSEANPRLALFKARVEAGTYIRTLCDDIGKEVGGARMVELRRIAVGKINESEAVKMHDLIDAVWLWKNKNDDSLLRKILRPPEEFIDFPQIVVKDTAINSLIQGAQLTAVGIKDMNENIKTGNHVSLYSENNEFIGVGVALADAEEIKKMKKGIVVKIERIHTIKTQ